MASTYGSITASTESQCSSNSRSYLTEHEKKEGRFVTVKTNSAFSNIMAKGKILFPYIWPKGEFYCSIVLIKLNNCFWNVSVL